MKKIAFVTICFLLVAACANHPAHKEAGAVKDSLIYYPYSPVYSGSFKKGSDINALHVLQIWKEWETGDLLHSSGKFADSISIILPDRIMNGRKDSLLTMMKKRREAFAGLQSYVDAWLAVKPVEKNEELVLLWGRQDFTRKDGSRDYRMIHEIWRFDPQGRITSWEQYQTHPY